MNYQAHYDKLIAKAQARGKPKGYSERHHIIPKCMGGDNSKGNLVALTLGEHYIAHRLLCKIYPENNSLKIAMRAFGRPRKINGERGMAPILNHRQYEIAKSIAIDGITKLNQSPLRKAEQSALMKKLANQPAFKEAVRLRAKEMTSDPNWKAEQSRKIKEKYKSDPKYKAAQQRFSADYWSKEENRKSQSIRRKQYLSIPENRAANKASCLQRYIDNPSLKDKMSATKKARIRNNPSLLAILKKQSDDFWSDEDNRNKAREQRKEFFKNNPQAKDALRDKALAKTGVTIEVTMSNHCKVTVFGMRVAAKQFGVDRAALQRKIKGGPYTISCKAPEYAGLKIIAARYI